MPSQEGLLLAVPAHFFDEGLLLAAQTAPEVLGRSECFEEEGLIEHGQGIQCW